MNTLAQWNESGGPGPWVLFFPLVWAAVIGGAVMLLRRTVWRGAGRPGRPWRGAPGADAPREHGPGGPSGPGGALGLLDHRFASGEIDEDEYWRRLSVLNESAHGRESGKP
ncbi:SHOCT domain-containing protein [Streptomyces daliensis]|uniref:SHOCT domain-containing protein n=1 Tax=Streptomyces daliensis TaxID=299421 RepID=A0A8T4IZ68_9ACTN|nr:SHOCT domain-containing protein [Streptomyces daliensis]